MLSLYLCSLLMLSVDVVLVVTFPVDIVSRCCLCNDVSC